MGMGTPGRGGPTMLRTLGNRPGEGHDGDGDTQMWGSHHTQTWGSHHAEDAREPPR